MTTRIEIDGVIGWEVTAADVRAALAEAGERVELRIHSPGGDLFEGVAIANLLRDYRRAGGRVQAVAAGVVASMATYIAMFADELAVEDNAVFVVHNPSMWAGGDYRVMRKAGAILASLRDLLARGYTAKTRHDPARTFADMDEERWLFGAEIVDAGYADAVLPAGDGPETVAEARALAEAAVAHVRAKLKDRELDGAALDRIAALLPTPLPAASSAPTPETPMSAPDPATDETTPAAPVPAPATASPAPPADPPADPAEQAVAAERARVSAILRACAAARCPERAQAMIDEGLSADAARAHILEAWAAQGGPELRQHGQGDPVAAASADWDAAIAKLNARRA